MNKYPGIYKALDGTIYYHLNKSNFFSPERIQWEEDCDNDNHETDINITAEYLANTYGKVESKEHAEFIKLIANNEGIKCSHLVVSNEVKYFYFSDGVLFFTFEKIDDDRFKLITIPLPPKDKPMESQKEWPQVGDEALTNSLEKVEVLALDNGVAWVKHLVCGSSFGYISVEAKYLSKPPTPEEELTSALLEYANSDNYSCEWKGFAKSIINGEIKGLSYKPE